ncbi:GATA zinc finger domain-containing protein 10-like [Drosophila virilis]|uniref:GATA zinc finger domain-containing protein 10-like n=1 Tax=Drosophila virilis TaxID=7244 RepID=UPI0038B2A8AB
MQQQQQQQTPQQQPARFSEMRINSLRRHYREGRITLEELKLAIREQPLSIIIAPYSLINIATDAPWQQNQPTTTQQLRQQHSNLHQQHLQQQREVVEAPSSNNAQSTLLTTSNSGNSTLYSAKGTLGDQLNTTAGLQSARSSCNSSNNVKHAFAEHGWQLVQQSQEQQQLPTLLRMELEEEEANSLRMQQQQQQQTPQQQPARFSEMRINSLRRHYREGRITLEELKLAIREQPLSIIIAPYSLINIATDAPWQQNQPTTTQQLRQQHSNLHQQHLQQQREVVEAPSSNNAQSTLLTTSNSGNSTLYSAKGTLGDQLNTTAGLQSARSSCNSSNNVKHAFAEHGWTPPNCQKAPVALLAAAPTSMVQLRAANTQEGQAV